MNLSRFNLHDIPDLSFYAVEELDLSTNSIRSLDVSKLPRGLKRLHLENNDLTQDGMPAILPDTLEELYLAGNSELFSLREIQVYPSCLKLLDLAVSTEDMSDFHCQKLDTLVIHHTNIKIVQNLPKTLKHLCGNYTQIRLLPNRLPPTMEKVELNCGHLTFGGLPRFWGNTLVNLSLKGNSIEKFPVKLPDTLQVINLACNRLTEVPAKLPDQLMVLNLQENNIRKIHVERRAKPIRMVFLHKNQLTESAQSVNARAQGRWASLIEDDHNWNEPKHDKAILKMQKVWRRFRMSNRLRTWRRTGVYKEELFMIAMMPERVWQTDTISPEWKKS